MMEVLRYHLSSVPPIIAIALGSWILPQLSTSEVQHQFTGSSSTFIYSMIIILISSILAIFIFTHLKKDQIRLLYAIVLTFPIIDLLVNISSQLPLLLFWLSSIPFILFILSFFVIYSKGINRILIRNSGVIISALVVSYELSSFLTLEAVLLITFLFAIFDIYSVFRGPVSKIMGRPRRVIFRIPEDEIAGNLIEDVCKKGTPVYIASKYSLLGIGDLFFFSLMFFKSLELSVIFFLLAFIFIILGSMCTLLLLRLMSPLPALPIPITFVGIFLVVATT